MSIAFSLDLTKRDFLGSGRRRCVPLCWLHLSLRIVSEQPWLITSDDLCEKRWVLRTFLKQISSDQHATFHLIRGQLPGNKLRTDTSQLQIVGQNRINGCVRDPNFLFHSTMAILRSHWISCRTFSIISSVLDVEGLPLRWSSSNVSWPFLNRENPVLNYGFLQCSVTVNLLQGRQHLWCRFFPICTWTWGSHTVRTATLRRMTNTHV